MVAGQSGHGIRLSETRGGGAGAAAQVRTFITITPETIIGTEENPVA